MLEMKKDIYLDMAATTPVHSEVIQAMKPYWNKQFGNPSSITKGGISAKKTINKARQIVADSLARRPNEIIFTSGGTESNNLAIFGTVNYLEKRGYRLSDLHFITTNIEHSSVLECFKEISRRGGQVNYLEVGPSGIVNLKNLRKLIKQNTVLISIGYANNEIGTIQPIREIAREIRHAKKSNQILSQQEKTKFEMYPYFHSDASQAGLYLNLNVNELGIDLMTLDAQKIYGPKGIGILFIKAGINLSPIIFGGEQEKGLRSGTENVALIAGQAKALEVARKDFEKKAIKIKKIRDYFLQKIIKEIPNVIINGNLENRLPNNLNISIPGIDSEFVILCLDEIGIVCSTKSACQQHEDVSTVIEALGQGETVAKSTFRFSLADNITKVDINYVVNKFKLIIQKQLTDTIY